MDISVVSGHTLPLIGVDLTGSRFFVQGEDSERIEIVAAVSDTIAALDFPDLAPGRYELLIESGGLIRTFPMSVVPPVQPSTT